VNTRVFFPGIGWVYYNVDSIASIVSMGLAEQQGILVEYSTSRGGRFEVFNPKTGRTTFSRRPTTCFSAT